MPNRSTHALVASAIAILLALFPGFSQHALAQPTGDDAPAVSTVDLATVPAWPGDFPEQGYQLSQAGDLGLSALMYAWSGDGLDESAWAPLTDHFAQAYSTVNVLLSDRADPASPPLSTVAITVVLLDSAESTADAATVFEDIIAAREESTIGSLWSIDERDRGLVIVEYLPASDTPAIRQNTEDWSEDSVADLATLVGDRLETELEDAERGDDSFGIANLRFYGPDAIGTITWPEYPDTEHYRVRDGEVISYTGELAADTRDATPEGAVDLFVSRQLLGDEDYDHVVDVSLARFENESDARAYARDPLPVMFPGSWDFPVEYEPASDPGDDVVIEVARANSEALVASGYRTIRREGTVVQVVQWLASGNGTATKDGMRQVTDWQSACLDALPDPCAALGQDEFPAALDAESDRASSTPVATPAAGDGTVLASSRYGWSVLLPEEDGWEITDAEVDTGTDYFQIQSGRSLVTIESARDRVGEPVQCVLDNLSLLQQLEDRAVITLGSDDPDERTAGTEPNHAWAIYTVEPLQDERSDQEYTIRFDCYTLEPGQVSLVVSHTAPRDLWSEERDKGERFRDAILIPPPTEIARITPLAGDGRDTGRTHTMGIPRIWMNRAA